MIDIVEELKRLASESASEVFASSIVPCATLLLAASEITRLRTTVEQLRAVAGAVSVDGQSFADIKRDIGK